MSQALIVPDLHERVNVLEILEKHMDQADHVYLLGDYYDNFKSDQGRVLAMIKWLKAKAKDLKFTKLLGNHDLHYLSNHYSLKCSGYSEITKINIQAEMNWSDWENFELFAIAGPYTLSHAGFVADTYHLATPGMENEALDALKRNLTHAWFNAGYARGGRDPIGGPTWLDWNREFDVIEGTPQIVGHTQGREVRVKAHGTPIGGPDRSFCIDTSSHHVVWVDETDGKLEFEEITWK